MEATGPMPDTLRALMKRRHFLQHTAAAGLGLSGLLQQALAAEPAVYRQGIRQIRGTVLVNGKPARAGMRLQPEDTVATMADSEVTSWSVGMRSCKGPSRASSCRAQAAFRLSR